MSYLSVNVKASSSSRENGARGWAQKRNIIKRLNNIFYDSKKNKMCGGELKSLVCGRKLACDWAENKYNSMILIVYDKEWKVNNKKWDDMADYFNELYVADQMREKIVDMKSNSTYVIELDVYPVFDE